MSNAIDQNKIKELFNYKDGDLIYKKSKTGRIIKGNKAGSLDKGYIRVQIDRKLYLLHRLIYVYHNGEIKDGYVIDHIDGNTLNNDITNLQMITPRENYLKAKTRKDNTSSCRGVFFRKTTKRWIANINVHKERIILGSYEHLEDAIHARKEAEVKYFGRFQPLTNTL